ncbi:MAG: hypothetical protein ACUVQP_09930, partial [Bacteroidales bacterium]
LTRLERAVAELAEAQKRTEKEVKSLAKALGDTRKMVGGLSDAVGYGLEDRAIKNLPALLKERFNIDVEGRLVRRFITYNGKSEEINIYGKGKKNGEELILLGEAKARLSKKHVDELLEMTARLQKYGVLSSRLFLLLITYSTKPDVEEYAKAKGVEVMWSYDV